MSDDDTFTRAEQARRDILEILDRFDDREDSFAVLTSVIASMMIRNPDFCADYDHYFSRAVEFWLTKLTPRDS